MTARELAVRGAAQRLLDLLDASELRQPAQGAVGIEVITVTHVIDDGRAVEACERLRAALRAP